MNKIVPALLAALLLAACGSTPKTGAGTGATIEDRTPGAGTSSSDGSIQTITPDAPTGSPLAILKDPRSILSKRSVYFDFDSSEIRAEYVPVVAAHAAYLVKFPTGRVRLEGHTDEKGSREYNIGLGERRAQTVRRALMLQGVAEAQITTVSYGEERPAVEGSDDAALAQNRRVELVHAQ